MVDIGANGRVSDWGVLYNTSFYKKFQENKINISEDDYLPGINGKIPYIFVTDKTLPTKKFK